jgi:excisionase family DNA binding protein
MTDALLNEKNPFEGWVTLQEAALIIGRDNSVVRYWAKKGYIKAHKVGRRTKLVNLEQVKAYAENHQSHLTNDEEAS